MFIQWMINVIYQRLLEKKNDTGRAIQVMVESTKIQRYMSNDLPTLVYKSIV